MENSQFIFVFLFSLVRLEEKGASYAMHSKGNQQHFDVESYHFPIRGTRELCLLKCGGAHQYV